MDVNLEVRRYNGGGRHYHDYAQILFPLQGAMRLTIEDRQRVVTSHHVAVIPVVRDHEFVPSRDCSLLVLDVDLAGTDGAAVPALLRDETPRISRMQPWLWRIFRQIGFEVDADRHRAHEAAALAVSGLNLIQPSPTAEKRSPAVQRIERLAADIGEQPARDGIEAMARETGLGQSQFHALFKATTGRSPRQYQIDRRLEAAMDRLISTSDTVSEIAYSMGYQNVSSFNRLFKARFGITPGQFRVAGDRFEGK